MSRSTIRGTVALPVLLVACGGAGSGAAPVAAPPPGPAAQVQPAPAEPPPVPVPEEPAGLAELKGSSGGCKLSAFVEQPLELFAPGRAAPFARVAAGKVEVSPIEGASPFVEVQLPSRAVLKGFGTWAAAQGKDSPSGALVVYARRWMAFGGVYYPGAQAQLTVIGVHGDKLTVAPADGMVNLNPLSRIGAGMADFELSVGQSTLEVPCEAVSLAPDADGALRQSAPQPFLHAASSKEKDQQQWLAANKPVPVSAAPDGPAGGSLDASAYPAGVYVIERRGRRARIRYEHVAGWVDAAALFPTFERATAHVKPAEHEFGMVGLLQTDPSDEQIEARSGVRWSCTHAVRIVTELDAPTASSAAAGPARFVVGSIPAGVKFEVEGGAGGLASVIGGRALTALSGARVAVPLRDIATASCVQSTEPARASSPSDASPAEAAATDAIDALDGTREAVAAAGSEGAASDFGFHPTPMPEGLERSSGQKPGGHLRLGEPTVSGRLPPEVIKRIARQNQPRLRACHEQALKSAPTLAGKLSLKFVIDRAGRVSNVSKAGGDINNAKLISCLTSTFYGLSFPQPEGGIVVVTYPIELGANK